MLRAFLWSRSRKERGYNRIPRAGENGTCLVCLPPPSRHCKNSDGESASVFTKATSGLPQEARREALRTSSRPVLPFHNCALDRPWLSDPLAVFAEHLRSGFCRNQGVKSQELHNQNLLLTACSLKFLPRLNSDDKNPNNELRFKFPSLLLLFKQCFSNSKNAPPEHFKGKALPPT